MIVPITDDDVPDIVALMNRAYRGSGASAGWNTEAAYIAGDRTTADLLRADLRAKPEASFLKWVAPSSDEVLGCVYLAPEAGGTWYLGSLAADPDQQRSGLGSALLSAAEEWVRQQGGTRVRMTVVNVRESLIAWYLRRGYRLTGATEPFPYGDNRFGTPLRDDLAFVVLEKALVEPNGGS
jgi:ribosomal protein S18 acetylase RimI-like enzyme